MIHAPPGHTEITIPLAAFVAWIRRQLDFSAQQISPASRLRVVD
jgi:hypothetical protein